MWCATGLKPKTSVVTSHTLPSMAQTFDILQSLTEHQNFISHLIAESKCILKSGSMLSHASQTAECRGFQVMRCSLHVFSLKWKSSDQTKLYTRYRIKSEQKKRGGSSRERFRDSGIQTGSCPAPTTTPWQGIAASSGANSVSSLAGFFIIKLHPQFILLCSIDNKSLILILKS